MKTPEQIRAEIARLKEKIAKYQEQMDQYNSGDVPEEIVRAMAAVESGIAALEWVLGSRSRSLRRS